jgi:hypothetical protein
MQTSDPLLVLYRHAWVGLAFVSAYYILAVIAFRWRPQRSAIVTKYEPPPGISAAVAAFLWERGRYERAFAAAFISLASNGFLTIQQKSDSFSLHRVRKSHAAVPAEESSILKVIFPGSLDCYSFDTREYGCIDRAFAEFRKAIQGRVRSDLISRHTEVWLAGVVFLLVVLARVAAALVSFPEASVKSVLYLYLLLWIGIGGSCFVAALHTWPATVRKLLSFIPGIKGRRRKLNPSDGLPICLTASALLGFVFLASLTSPRFAVLTAAAVFLSAVFRHALESPTAKGYRVLSELKGFREFVARVEVDRFNSENSPGRSPETLEKFIAYAVALDVERGWGEELAENLLELLQFDEAYGGAVSRKTSRDRRSREPRTYPPKSSFTELGIASRNVLD